MGRDFVSAGFLPIAWFREPTSFYLVLLEEKGRPTVSNNPLWPEDDRKRYAIAAGSENKQEL